MPLVVIEGLANGRPVIASDQAGIAHVIKSGVNGFLVEPGNSQHWKEQLTAWAQNPNTIRNLRANCTYTKNASTYVDELEAKVNL